MLNSIGLILVSLLPAAARADEVCPSLAELRNKVVYCDDNFAYYEAAKVCKEKYLADVKVEQERVKRQIEAQVKAISDTKQARDMAESQKALQSAITTLDYLIDYGKEMHSELEDYVYELVLPAFDESEAQADLSNPAVKQEFMTRECFGDPAQQIENMQKEARPVIADLEKTRAQAVLLKGNTNTNQSNLDSVNAPNPTGKGLVKAAVVAPSGKHQERESDVSGIKEDEAKRKKLKP